MIFLLFMTLFIIGYTVFVFTDQIRLYRKIKGGIWYRYYKYYPTGDSSWSPWFEIKEPYSHYEYANPAVYKYENYTNLTIKCPACGKWIGKSVFCGNGDCINAWKSMFNLDSLSWKKQI